MSLSELEQNVLAFFLAGPAQDLNVAGRYFPYNELILIYEDKFAIATRKFGPKVKACAKAAATVFVDSLIAADAYSTKNNDFGGSMHQFKLDEFRSWLKQECEGNPIVKKSQDGGPEFWAETFAALTETAGN